MVEMGAVFEGFFSIHDWLLFLCIFNGDVPEGIWSQEIIPFLVLLGL